MAVLKFKDVMGNWHSIPAIQGASAYEQAVDGGYQGTLEDFYLALNEVNAAVQAAEDAEDSASAAAASALQLASGVASPAGTYANLTALNAGTPTVADTDEIYITLDDGKWCYHNGTAFVVGGAYQGTSYPELTNARTNIDGEAHITASARIQREIDKLENAIGYAGTSSEEVPLLFKIGTINSSGVDTASTTIARNAGFLEFDVDEVVKLHGGAGIYFKIYRYALNGDFSAIMSGNLSGDYTFVSYGGNYKYRFTIWYTNSRVITGVGDLSALFEIEKITLATVVIEKTRTLRETYVNCIPYGVTPQLPNTADYNSYNLFETSYVNAVYKELYIRSVDTDYTFKVYKYNSSNTHINTYTGLSAYTITDDGYFYKFAIVKANAGQIVEFYDAALAAVQVFTGGVPIGVEDIVPKAYSDGVTFSAPSNVVAVVGHELNIYFDSFVTANRPQDVRYEVICSTLTSHYCYSECIRITPLAGDIGAHTLTISAYTVDYVLITSTTITLTIIADIALAAVKKVMFIGDSLTNDGTILSTLSTLLGENLTLYGTCGTAPLLHEGRPGWSAYKYTHSASISGVSNPFWNPATSLFDFTYYMTNNAAYADVEYVNIYLGINGAFHNNDLVAIQAMVASIHAYNSGIIITICTGSILPDSNDGGAQYIQNIYSFRAFAKAFNAALFTAFSGVANTLVVPTHINVDSVHDYPHSDVAVSGRNPELISRYSDNVHPSVYGYYKIADVLYNCFVSLFD